MSDKEIKEIVREKYGQIASNVSAKSGSSCCGAGASSSNCCDPVTSNLYDINQQSCTSRRRCRRVTWAAAIRQRLPKLKEGQVVLDLGSGGGIDVLLSARRVGQTGKVYGLDMTDEMLSLARKNAAEAGVNNVEFLKGEMEDIPLPDDCVDVIISNCVINLSADKRRLWRKRSEY